MNVMKEKILKKINKLYLKSSEVADHVVFVSEWLRKIYLNLGMEKEKTSVIMSGSDTLIFNPYGATKKPVNRKFKVLDTSLEF